MDITVDELKERMKEAVQVDELALDKECVRMPGTYLKFSNLAAELRRDQDAAKVEMEKIESQLSKAIRLEPGKYSIEKVTEAAIGAAIGRQKVYLEAAGVYAECRYKCDLVQGCMTALEHKKRSLTMLVDLYGMSYFSSPKLSAEGQKAVEAQTKDAVRPRRRATTED